MIKPIYKKKGDINNPDSYRGITLLSCVGKFFTLLLNDRLKYFVDENKTLFDEQIGFRKGHSTIDHIFTLHSVVNWYLHKRKRLYLAFIDYKKAFDSVDRSILWTKLISAGVGGRFLRVIQNMYAKAKSCVKTSALSELFSCNVGVRQGENLSPLLFALFLNDLPIEMSKVYNGLLNFSDLVQNNLSNDEFETLLKLYVLLYADDTVIMAESPMELQNSLNEMARYCEKNKLIVNASKSNVMVVSRGKIRNKPVFKYGNDI